MDNLKGWNGITLYKETRKNISWHIRIVSHANNGVTIAAESEQWSDTAIYYRHNGTIAWDFPERIPTKIRNKAETYLRDMREAGVP